MKRVYSVKIIKNIEKDEVKTREEAAKSMQTILKMGLNVDDVVIEDVQDFEVEGEEK